MWMLVWVPAPNTQIDCNKRPALTNQRIRQHPPQCRNLGSKRSQPLRTLCQRCQLKVLQGIKSIEPKTIPCRKLDRLKLWTIHPQDRTQLEHIPSLSSSGTSCDRIIIRRSPSPQERDPSKVGTESSQVVQNSTLTADREVSEGNFLKGRHR